ncbi:MAG: hypothetical protein SGJ26_07280 [Nitrospirota bacterium]|nr:hypothetical protein [Nitrospirota bacterium]
MAVISRLSWRAVVARRTLGLMEQGEGSKGVLVDLTMTVTD